MKAMTVFSLGGSIVVPDEVDTDYVDRFVSLVRRRLERSPASKVAIVVGGGSTARRFQAAAREIGAEPAALDEIGIAATRLNAALVKAAFGELCCEPVFGNPTSVRSFSGRVLVGGGWKPGFSTDNVAVRLAESLGADTVVNLSNIRQVYTADPRVDPDAKPLATVRWTQFLAIVGDEWVPGKNTPFDPVASRRAAELAMTVVAVDGRDLDNLEALLDGRAFTGTTIRP